MPTEPGHLLSDHDLVAQAQGGDAGALDTLIRQVRDAVLPYCRARLGTYGGGADLAEDVTQETCMAVVDVLPRYRREGPPFRAFVYAIAANKVTDAQRRFGRSPLTGEEVPDQVEPAATPEEQVLVDADVRAAWELVGRLPQRMRQVVQLRALGLSVDAVAEATGLSPTAVRVTHHRATAKLTHLVAASAEHRERFSGRLRRPGAA